MVIDPSAGHPLKYDDLAILESAVASTHVRLELDVQHGKGWRRTGTYIDTHGEDGLGDAWCEDISQGARHILQMTYVPAGDEHYDARVFPHVHPYGTGSLLSELGTGALQHHCRARALALQSWFRQSSLWCFWQLDLSIKRALFFGRPRPNPI